MRDLVESKLQQNHKSNDQVCTFFNDLYEKFKTRIKKHIIIHHTFLTNLLHLPTYIFPSYIIWAFLLFVCTLCKFAVK